MANNHKKINYGIVCKVNGKEYQVRVEGESLDNNCAVRKDAKSKTWVLDNPFSGLAIMNGFSTRKAAIETYNTEVKAKVKKLVESREFSGKLEYKNSLPVAVMGPDGEIVKPIEPKAEKKPTKSKSKPKKQEKPKAEKPEVEEPNVDELTAENIGEYAASILIWLCSSRRNAPNIVAAGYEAGAVTDEELLAYLTEGRMPNVHTFDEWKKAGKKVKKGEHAKFEALIWKHKTMVTGQMTAEKAEQMNRMIEGANYKEGDDIESENFIRVKAYFFTAEQVEEREELPPKQYDAEPIDLNNLPEGITMENKRRCVWLSGDTKEVKESIKAAGFRWSKKNKAWYKFQEQEVAA